jgi:tetratricopeptide (TPR) repeat protein
MLESVVLGLSKWLVSSLFGGYVYQQAVKKFGKDKFQLLTERALDEVLKKEDNRIIWNKIMEKEDFKIEDSTEFDFNQVCSWFSGEDTTLCQNLFENLQREYLKQLYEVGKEDPVTKYLLNEVARLDDHEVRIKRLETIYPKILELYKYVETVMRPSTVAVSFCELPAEENLRYELGPFELAYITRESIPIDDLAEKENIVFTGKCGSGKSRLLFEVLKGKKNVVFLKSFFKETDIPGLEVLVQDLTDFVIVWDNLHMVKEEDIRGCLQRISTICQKKGVDFRFFGASRKENIHYGLLITEVSLPDMRKVQLVDACSTKYKKEISEGVAEHLLEAGDGTPEYILSFFKTFKKEEIIEEDLKDCPGDVVELWVKYIKDMDIKGTAVEKALRSVALSSRGFEQVILEYVEDVYCHVFYGGKSHFDDSIRSLQEMFFIEKTEGETYSFHDSRAEAVEKEFPLEMMHVNRLITIVSEFPEEDQRHILRKYAEWSFFAKRYEICVRFYDFIIELSPEDAQAHGNRGNAYYKSKQVKKAIEDYDRAIEIDPEYALAYYNRGNAHSELNQYERAIEDFDKAIEIDPELPQAYYNRGLAYYKSKQYEKAIRDFDKAIEIDNEDAQAYGNRGNAHSELNQYEKAIRDYDKAIEIDPGLALAYTNRGLAYSELNQVEKAIRDFDRALKLKETLPDKGARAYYFLGEAMERMKNFEEAAQAFKNAGITFFSLEDLELSLACFLKGFKLIKHIQNENVEYCGLFLYIRSKDNNIKDTLQKIKVQNKPLDSIFTLALKKDKGEDIKKEVQDLSNTHKSSDILLLLSRLTMESPEEPSIEDSHN